MKTENVMWLLVVVFMIHDFEEIIMFEPWVNKNAALLKSRFPRLAARMLPHFGGLSTSAFALAVALMFLIVASVTFVAVQFGLYALWAGMLIAFFIHLLIHIGQFLAVRRYVPVIITSLAAVPYCVWALAVVNERHPLPMTETVLWSSVGLVVMVLGIVFAHRLAALFERWLKEGFQAPRRHA